MSNTVLASKDEALQATILAALHSSWSPLPWQIKAGQALFRDHKKRLFLQNARKTGKTEYLLYCMVRAALSKPNSQIYFVAPFAIQARELILANRRLQQFIPPQFLEKINKTELRVTLTNGSFIKLCGADNSEALRGVQPDMLVIDECKDVPADFIEAFLPNMAVKRAPVIFAGTPPASENIYTKLAEQCQNDPESFWIQVPTSANSHIAPEEIERERIALFARGEEDVFAREWEGRFVRGGSRSIFPMFGRECVMPYSSMLQATDKDVSQLEWHVITDPGNSTVFGVLVFAYNAHTSQIWVFDEVYETRSTHTSVSKIWPAIEERQKDLGLPDSIEWNYTSDEAATWFRNEVMDRYPKLFIAPTRKAERTKEAGITLLKDLMLAGKFRISDRCVALFRELENYVKDNEGRIPKRNDHLIDCCRYLLGAVDCQLSAEAKERPQIPEDPEEEVTFHRFAEADILADLGRDRYSFEFEE